MDKTAEEPRTIIADDVEINGSIKCTGGVRIGGRMSGDLTCAGDVLVEKTSQIKGNLTVNSVVVLGAVKGNIAAKERIELKGNARVAGDIKAKRLVVEEGVTLIGKSEIAASDSASGEMVLDMDGGAAGAADDAKAGDEDGAKASGQALRSSVSARPNQLFARKYNKVLEAGPVGPARRGRGPGLHPQGPELVEWGRAVRWQQSTDWGAA